MKQGVRENMGPLIAKLDDVSADEALVDITSNAMAEKLKKKRRQNKEGWYIKEMITNEQLLIMLKKNLDDGDMVDVINLAAMVYVRSEIYGKEA